MKDHKPVPITATFKKMTLRALDLAYQNQADDNEVRQQMFDEIQRRVKAGQK